MARAPDPIVVVLSSARRSTRGMVGAVVSFALGLTSVAFAVFGGGDSADPSGRIGASVVGAALLVLGLLILASMGIGVGARDLTFSEEALAWGAAGRRGSWQVRWEELSSASLHLGYRGRPVNRNYRVRIEFAAADNDAFAALHPRLRRRRRRVRGGEPVYALALGPRRDLLDRLDNAFSIFGGQRYTGLVDDGALGGAIAPQIRERKGSGPFGRPM